MYSTLNKARGKYSLHKSNSRLRTDGNDGDDEELKVTKATPCHH